MRKHWNYWIQIFPASKRHIWKTLAPISKTGRVRQSRSVTRLFQLAENGDFHKSKSMIFVGSSSHFRRPLRDIVWFMKCAESLGRSRLKLIHEAETSIPWSGKLFIRLKEEVGVVFVVESKTILQKIQRTRQGLVICMKCKFSKPLKTKGEDINRPKEGNIRRWRFRLHPPNQWRR